MTDACCAIAHACASVFGMPMKISDVIDRLQEIMQEKGDIPVWRVSDELGDLDEPTFDVMVEKGEPFVRL